jgi:hypothetical protein
MCSIPAPWAEIRPLNNKLGRWQASRQPLLPMHADPADLLEHRLNELEAFIAAPRKLGVFDASATIRQLLLDQNPLVDIVNREFRLPLRFEVNRIPAHLTEKMEEEHRVLHLGPGLSPGRSTLGAGTASLTRDQFFREPVLLSAWRKVTVREFVLFAAHKAGGVHFDTTSDDTTQTLNALMRAVDSEDYPVFGSTMLSIADIVVRALQPLRERVSNREQD